MSQPKAARTTSRGRVYQWRGESYWSVTTIIKGGLPAPALMAWGIKSVAEYAVENANRLGRMVQAAEGDPEALDGVVAWLKGSPYRERDRAADLGTTLHELAEAHALGKPLPEAPLPAQPQLAQFHRFLDDWDPEFEMAEASVYNRTEQYAGTLDAIVARFRKAPALGRVLLDYKGGKGVYPEAGLQLSAYRHAEFVGLDGEEIPMPATDGGMVLHLRPDGYALLPVDTGDEVFRSFLFVREVFRFQEDIAKRVIGEQLTAPEVAA